MPQIVWLNKPTHKDFAHAGLAVSLPPPLPDLVEDNPSPPNSLSSSTRQPLTSNHKTQYGNEASLNYRFSFAAILVVVPPSEKRATIAPARREATNTSNIHPRHVVVASASSTASPSTTAPTPSESAGSGGSARMSDYVPSDAWASDVGGELWAPAVRRGFSGGF